MKLIRNSICILAAISSFNATAETTRDRSLKEARLALSKAQTELETLNREVTEVEANVELGMDAPGAAETCGVTSCPSASSDPAKLAACMDEYHTLGIRLSPSLVRSACLTIYRKDPTLASVSASCAARVKGCQVVKNEINLRRLKKAQAEARAEVATISHSIEVYGGSGPEGETFNANLKTPALLDAPAK